MKLGFIGCGNMAKAIAHGVVQSQLFPIDSIIATDIVLAAREAFYTETSIETTAYVENVLQAEFIILAIKPQQFADFLATYAHQIPPTSTIISIAAGKKTQWIQSYFSRPQPIVRIMPNLNATITHAVSAMTKNANVSAEQYAIAKTIVSSFGTVHELDETQFSTFTAIAGSSPAYFFKMIEAMSTSAHQHGIDYDIAKQIVIETMIGSALFASQTTTPLPTLIRNVTSPNGTTEAALRVFDDAQFDDMINDAQYACIQRDIELGKSE